MPAPIDPAFLRRLGAQALRFAAPDEDVSAVSPLDRVGPYELLDEIGRGGMGVVYTARQPGLERMVALKVMHGGRRASADAESRFEREAQTAARLRHAFIVPILESGRAAGQAYFAMEYFADGDLAHRIRQRPFSPREATGLLQKLATGVAFAHRAGVVHRDLKPSNILLEGDEPRIADFGLAALLHEGSDLTAHTSVLGTPHYLAPEAFVGGSGALTEAGDLYALGVIYYELLTGRTPFAGSTPTELPGAVATRDAVPPRLLRPTLARDFETICLRCLERNPGARYASAEALAEDLRRALADEPILARPPSALGSFLRWCRRRPALATAWLLLATLAAVAVTSTVIVWRANGRASEQLRSALLAQARAAQLSGRIGQRFDALEALRVAAGIHPGLDLRHAALAALALPDARIAASWRARVSATSPVAFDASTDRYVTESAEGVLTLHRRRDHAELRRFALPPGSPRPIYVAPFAPDGGHFAVRFADGSAAVYGTDDSTPRFVIGDRPVPPGLVYFTLDFCLTPGGRELALPRREGGVSFFDARTGAESGMLAAPFVPTVISISPDGRSVALVGWRSEDVEIYDRATGLRRVRLHHPAPVANCIWRADGQELATGCADYRIRLWQADSGAEKALLRGHEQVPTGLAYRADGAFLASSGRDLALRIWETSTGTCALTIPDIGGGAALGFAPDGKSLTFSGQGWDVGVLALSFGDVRADLWRAAPGDFADEVVCFDASADGRLLTLASRSGIRLFDARDGRELANLRHAPEAGANEFGAKPGADLHGARADDAGAQFGPRSDVLVYSVGGTGTWRRTLRWRDPATLEIGPAVSVDARPGLLVVHVLGDPARALLLGARSPLASLCSLSGSGGPVDFPLSGIPSSGQISPDGTAVLTADFPSHGSQTSDVHVWDAATGARVAGLGLGPGGSVHFRPDGSEFFASGWSQSFTYRWPSREPRREQSLPLGVGRYSPDGAVLAVAAVGRTALVGLPEGRLLGNLPGSLKGSLRFSPAGDRLFLYSGFQLHAWNLVVLRQQLAAIGLDWEGAKVAVGSSGASDPPGLRAVYGR